MAIDYVGKQALSFEAGKELEPIAQVILNLGTDDEGNELIAKYPTTDPSSGRIVEYELPLITSATVAANIAQNIYNKLSSFTYKPFSADGALLDPSYQIGDQVKVNGNVYGLGAIRTMADHLYSADISAPLSEEEDHEYGVNSNLTAGQIKRLVARTAASIKTTVNSITMSVIDTEGKITPASIVAAINGSESTVKISANHVAISGFVEFSDLSTAGRTTINGANITTGYISASRIDSGTLGIGDSVTPGRINFFHGNQGYTYMGFERSAGYEALYIQSADGSIEMGCIGAIEIAGSYIDLGTVNGLIVDCYGTATPSSSTKGYGLEGALYFKV